MTDTDHEWRLRLPESERHGPWGLPSRQARESLSWQIAVLLLRLHPERLRLVETHPGGGTYDCLSLYDRSDHTRGDLRLNRGGSATVMHRFDGSSGPDDMTQWRSLWSEALAADTRTVVEELARMSRLPDVKRVPPSNPEVLSFRLLSAFLSTKAFSSTIWESRMGYTDTSGHFLGDPIRHDLFAPFPELQKRLGARQDDDFLGIPAYRFWFLLRGEEPVLGIEVTTGVIEATNGHRHDLMELYRKAGRRLWPTVLETAGHLLS